MHHGEKRLFKGVFHFARFVEEQIEYFLDPPWAFQRMENTAVEPDRDLPESPCCNRVRKKIFRQGGMKIQDRVAVETHLRPILHHQLDGPFMVQDHWCLTGILPFRRDAFFQKALRFQQGAGISLESAGVPREVNQEPVENLASARAGGQPLRRRVADAGQIIPGFGRKGKVRFKMYPLRNSELQPAGVR